MSFTWRIVLTLLCAGVLPLALTPPVKWLACKLGAVDVPKDARRMHHKPIPRMGGLAIFIGFMTAVLLFQEISREIRGILIGATIIMVLGVLDDALTLRALPKFAVQIAAALIAVGHGCRIEQIMGATLPLWLSWTLSVLWIVGITNAINFIDGLDGLAAGVSTISAGSMLVISLILVPEGNTASSAVLLAACVGACIGFMPYNFNPAHIFMGDTGSTFLGFILSSVAIFGLFKTYAVFSFAIPFLVLGLPIFDITFAVVRRISRGQSPMHADRGHVHHRLIDMGFSQKQAVAICYLLSAVLGFAAVVVTDSGEIQALIFLAAVLIVAAIGIFLVYELHRRPRQRAQQPPQEQKEETDEKEN